MLQEREILTLEVISDTCVTNMSDRGQVVIPKEIRELLKIECEKTVLGFIPVRIHKGGKVYGAYKGEVGVLYFPVDIKPRAYLVNIDSSKST